MTNLKRKHQIDRLLVLALLSFLGDMKGSVAWLKGLRRKKQEKRTS